MDVTTLKETLRNSLFRTWKRSDWIFNDLITKENILERPIELRFPFIFYLGHLPSFSWNVMNDYKTEKSKDKKYHDMFRRGMDPDVSDPSICHSHSEMLEIWPSYEEVDDYKSRVRYEILDKLEISSAENLKIFTMILEHEYMHQETLMYMYIHMNTNTHVKWPRNDILNEESVKKEKVFIEGGKVILGKDIDSKFAWDNEIPKREYSINSFLMDNLNVTIGEFLIFINEGHYNNKNNWTEDTWKWKESFNLQYPVLWENIGGSFYVKTMEGLKAIDDVLRWPVIVSHAEASAYAKWKYAFLPSELEYHRAVYTSKDGSIRKYPWGEDDPISGIHGNFGWINPHCTPVGSHPEGISGWGIHDSIGDAWEWTSTVFDRHNGFSSDPLYPGYSEDFFDGKHFVLKGASYVTDSMLVRSTFRNWYQDKYLYMFAKFRLVYRI